MSTPVAPSTPSTPNGPKLTLERRVELKRLCLIARKSRIDADGLANLDASLKKNTAFIKRLRNINGENYESILNECLSLKMTKYIEEAASAVLESRFKTAGDLAGLIEVISFLHCRYADFTLAFLNILNREIESAEPTIEERSAWLVRQRQLLRLQAELLLVGIIDDPSVVLKNLRRLLPEDDVKGSLHISVATSFAKTLGPYFIQKESSVNNDFYADILENKWKEKFSGVLTSYFKAMSRLLVRCHQKVKSFHAKSRFYYENRGDLSSKQATELQEMMDSFEKLCSNLQILADALELAVPELGPSVESPTIVEGKVVFVDPSISRQEVKSLVHDNEEDRSFYEDIIDLKDIIPETLLNFSTITAFDSGNNSPQPEVDLEDINGFAEIDPESVVGKPMDPSIFSDDRIPVSAFFEKLPNMKNRALADQAAIDFCFVNSKTMQKRLAEMLIDLPYKRLDLLPFIGRFLATIKPYFPLVAKDICSSLIGQFTFLFHCRGPVIGTRSRVCRYIGELIKFGAMPQTSAYAMLKRMVLEDLTGYNIDMTAIILESCGRYLFHQPESHKRLLNLFEIIKKKEAQGMEPMQIVMLENAIYFCDPPSAPIFSSELMKKPPKSGRLQYLLKLVRVDLDKNNYQEIAKKILKFPRQELDCREEMARGLLKAWKIKYNRIDALALLIKELNGYCPELVIDLIDRLLEEVRFCLDLNQSKHNQRLLAIIKYFGELFNLGIVQEDLILWTLQFLITHGHSGIPRLTIPSSIDSLDSHLRIRMACLLMQTCFSRTAINGNVDNNKSLSMFLPLFEYYVALKKVLSFPMDLSFLLDDTYEDINCKRPDDFNFKDSIQNLIHAFGDQFTVLLPDVDFKIEDITTIATRANEEFFDTRVLRKTFSKPIDDEFDRALSGMVSVGIEERKFERKIGAFDAPIPLGLAALSFLSSPPSNGGEGGGGPLKLLLKKKNKTTVKGLVFTDQTSKVRSIERPTTPKDEDKNIKTKTKTIHVAGLRRTHV